MPTVLSDVVPLNTGQGPPRIRHVERSFIRADWALEHLLVGNPNPCNYIRCYYWWSICSGDGAVSPYQREDHIDLHGKEPDLREAHFRQD